MSDEQSKHVSEFYKALSEFIPPPKVEERYRIYYNSEGEITHQVHNEAGKPTGPCLELGLEEYKAVSHVLHESIIKDGEIVKKQRKVRNKLLQPSSEGYAVMRNNLAFPDDNNPEYWDHGYS